MRSSSFALALVALTMPSSSLATAPPPHGAAQQHPTPAPHTAAQQQHPTPPHASQQHPTSPHAVAVKAVKADLARVAAASTPASYAAAAAHAHTPPPPPNPQGFKEKLACLLVRYPEVRSRFCPGPHGRNITALTVTACKWMDLVTYATGRNGGVDGHSARGDGLVFGCVPPAPPRAKHPPPPQPPLGFPLAPPPPPRLASPPANATGNNAPMVALLLTSMTDYAEIIADALELDDIEAAAVPISPLKDAAPGVLLVAMLAVLCSLSCAVVCTCGLLVWTAKVRARTEARLRVEYEEKLRRVNVGEVAAVTGLPVVGVAAQEHDAEDGRAKGDKEGMTTVPLDASP